MENITDDQAYRLVARELILPGSAIGVDPKDQGGARNFAPGLYFAGFAVVLAHDGDRVQFKHSGALKPDILGLGSLPPGTDVYAAGPNSFTTQSPGEAAYVGTINALGLLKFDV